MISLTFRRLGIWWKDWRNYHYLAIRALTELSLWTKWDSHVANGIRKLPEDKKPPGNMVAATKPITAVTERDRQLELARTVMRERSNVLKDLSK